MTFRFGGVQVNTLSQSFVLLETVNEVLKYSSHSFVMQKLK